MLAKIILAFLFCIILLACYPMTINEGEVVILEKSGNFYRVLQNGTYLVSWLQTSERFVHWCYKGEHITECKFDSRIQINRESMLDPGPIKCTTLDDIVVFPNVVIFYEIIDPVMSVYKVDNLYEAIVDAVSSVIKDAVSAMKLDSYTEKAHMVAIIHEIHEITNKWGVSISRVEIQTLGIPKILSGHETEKQKHDQKNKEHAVLSQKIREALSQLHGELNS